MRTDMRVLLVLFLVANFSCAMWNKAIAGSSDTKLSKPEYIKFDKNIRGSSLDKSQDKIPTPDFDKPINTMPKPPDYIKNKISLPDSAKTIPKPEHLKYKQPGLPDFNKDMKTNLPDASFHYFNMGVHYEKAGRTKDAIESYKKFITCSPPKNASYIDYAKQKIIKLEKINSGLGKGR